MYRTPMKFGGRVVVDVDLLNVTVEVETQSGKRGVGRGSMPMGNAWGWPSMQVTGDKTLSAMIKVGNDIAAVANKHSEFGHPLELSHTIMRELSSLAMKATSGYAEPMPRLAQLVAASPLDAALHDAQGQALGTSSYHLLGSDCVNTDLSHYLGDDFAGEYLDAYVSPEPQTMMPLYHLVGALDPLTEDDIPEPLADGLPETLPQWVVADGLTHLKIKLAGDDLEWDVARVANIEEVTANAQSARGCAEWFYSLDFNERCASVDYVLEFLAKLEERSSKALARVQYIEQPTHRDLKNHPTSMKAAADIKPVVIDESLIDFESLLLAREQGYSGVALKACKGHSEALLMGAAAQKYNMFLCVQDLTCPGASFLHSASLAAHVPGVAAIEGNGRQYCPAGNEGWNKRYPGMFEIDRGVVATHELNGPGLGFTWV